MDFRILGPLEAESGGQPLRLGGPRQRALLAYLLLHANEAVSSERLLGELWFAPPLGGAAALQTQVSRVRKVVGAKLVRSDSGYELRVEESELDLLRLRGALAQAGSAGTPGDRSRLLRDADGLWRGEPLAGLDAPFVAAETAALEELRIGAIEERIDADLERGVHADLVAELSLLVSRHPLRERLRAQLMRALYRSGRQAEALVAYRDARRTLLDELGLEPSPALRDLERAILMHDDSLAAPSVVTGDPAEPQRIEPMPPLRSRRRTLVLAGLGSLVLLGAGSGATVLSLDADPTAAPAPHHSKPVAAHPTSRKKAVQPRNAAPVKRVVPVVHLSKVARRPARPAVVKVPRAPAHPASRPPITPATVGPATETRATTAPKAPAKKKAAQTPAAPATPMTFTDDFGNPSPNLAMWGNATEGGGPSWALANGRLELALPADAVPGGRYTQVNASFFSMCRFNGDFDAQVDFELLDWPAASGGIVQLAAWIFPDLNSGVARSNDQNGEKYSGNVGSTWQTVPTNDEQGAFRIARRGGVMSAYVEQNGAWLKLHSGVARGPVQLGLQLFAPGNDWAHEGVRAAFDNFAVTGTDVTCQ